MYLLPFTIYYFFSIFDFLNGIDPLLAYMEEPAECWFYYKTGSRPWLLTHHLLDISAQAHCPKTRRIIFGYKLTNSTTDSGLFSLICLGQIDKFSPFISQNVLPPGKYTSSWVCRWAMCFAEFIVCKKSPAIQFNLLDIIPLHDYPWSKNSQEQRK